MIAYLKTKSIRINSLKIMLQNFLAYEFIMLITIILRNLGLFELYQLFINLNSSLSKWGLELVWIWKIQVISFTIKLCLKILCNKPYLINSVGISYTYNQSIWVIAIINKVNIRSSDVLIWFVDKFNLLNNNWSIYTDVVKTMNIKMVSTYQLKSSVVAYSFSVLQKSLLDLYLSPEQNLHC